MLSISVLPAYVITMKRLKLCEIHRLKVCLISGGDESHEDVSQGIARDLSDQLFNDKVKGCQKLKDVCSNSPDEGTDETGDLSTHFLPGPGHV